MPSAFAHGVVGASLGVLAPPALRGAPLALGLAVLAALPDLDVVGLRWGVAYGDPLGHRGLTHSLPFAALVGAAVGAGMGAGVRAGMGGRARRPTRDRVALGGLAALACGSHGLLDTFTDAGLGVGLWLPFDATRSFAPFRPLATSPLSIERFLGPVGLRILANEALWIGLPTLLGLGLVQGGRRLRRRRLASAGWGGGRRSDAVADAADTANTGRSQP